MVKKKIHYDEDGFYICNKALGRYYDFISEVGRATKDILKVTCKNCIRFHLKNLTKHNNDFKKDLEIKKLKEDLTKSREREMHGASAGG